MKMAEVRKMSGEEIDQELDRLRRRLFDLRAQAVSEKVEDASQFRATRKDIARLLTERTSRLRAVTASTEGTHE